MTSIAMGAGMLPVAMGWAGDPSFRAPIGVAVMGGLFVSTLVSLFIVPVFFTLVEDGLALLRRKLQRHPAALAGTEPQLEH
jgi:multidrug efflux pump subunit AcrB